VTGFQNEGSGVAVQTDNGAFRGSALVGADGGRSVIREKIVGDPLPPATGHMCYRAVLDPADVPKDLRWAAATLWAAHNTHIVHYPLRGWKLFNLVATVIGKHTSGGHNEAATREEAVGFFSHYCEKVLKLMRTPKEYRRWMLLYRQPVANWTQGRVTLLGDAAHFMLQYMAQGAAMAMEDGVCLGLSADSADGNFEKAFLDYQNTRLARASRVHDGIERVVRNDMYRGRSPERYYDALEWVFSAPDYVRNFSKKAPSRRPGGTSAAPRARRRAARAHR
jgi:salicylate hydroxylase